MLKEQSEVQGCKQSKQPLVRAVSEGLILGSGKVGLVLVVDPSYWGLETLLYIGLQLVHRSWMASFVVQPSRPESRELDLIEVLHFRYRQMSSRPSISDVGRPEKGGLHRAGCLDLGSIRLEGFETVA